MNMKMKLIGRKYKASGIHEAKLDKDQAWLTAKLTKPSSHSLQIKNWRT
ncbi:MAG TPA: hypothetical protein VEG44_06490 [Candidatus Acidoferrales bacterium]|nr:hypothetical protein [Candidatus Acidoferrales bacterium]